MSVFGISLGIIFSIPKITITVTCNEGSSDEKSIEVKIFMDEVSSFQN